MMPAKLKSNFTFSFAPLSKRQLQVFYWWQAPQYQDKFALICDGSVRAGKTLIMSLSFVRWAMMSFDGEQFAFAGKTIGSLRRNVVGTLKRMLKSEGYLLSDNRSENYLTITKYGNTNIFYLFGGTNEASQDVVQGLTLAGFFFDEVALMPQSFVNQATSRLSHAKAKAWFNCNPNSPFHWFKQEWIDELTRKNAIRIHFMMKDNPSLDEATIKRYETMYSGVFYKRYILGEWAAADGLVYSNFDEDTMVIELPEATQYSQQVIGIDYGTQNPTVFHLWGKPVGKDFWYCRDEYYHSGRETGRQKTDEQYADDLESFFFENGLERDLVAIILDPSAASFRRSLKNRGFKVINANNDVLDGIRFMSSAINANQLRWSPKCSHGIAEFGSYIWDEKASQHGIDKVVKEHDHCLDADRYVVYKMLKKRKGSKVNLIKEGI